MLYIVKWIIITYYSVACPHPKPYSDEFGIRHESNITTMLACYETEKEFKQKTFDNRDSAFAFYKRALRRSKSNIGGIWESGVQGVTIDSTTKIFEE